ncbi:MAG: tyrosine-type recombinase/integrase [Gemmatimonadaceae bacterium]
MRQLLSASVIAAATPDTDRDRVIADVRIPGYQLKVTPAGRKILSLLYWSPVERSKRRRYTIGEVGAPVTLPDGRTGTLTAHTGRQIAEARRGEVKARRDPFLEQQGAARDSEAKETLRRARDLAARPLAVVIEDYLADAESRNLSARTIREWRRLLSKHVLPVIGSAAVAQVGASHALLVRRALPRGRRVLANRVQQVCCAVLNFADDERAGLPNPFAVGKRGRARWFKEEMTREPITRGELAALFKALDTAEDVDRGQSSDVIRLLALTGLRKGEALSLRWDAVDLSTGVITLAQSKTGRSERAFSPGAMKLLRTIPRRGPYVFPSPKYPSRPRTEIKRAWLRARAAAGIRKPLHALRHAVATIAISQGVPLAGVAALLGHVDTKTTERYAKFEQAKARKAAAVMGAAIARATAPTPSKKRKGRT